MALRCEKAIVTGVVGHVSGGSLTRVPNPRLRPDKT